MISQSNFTTNFREREALLVHAFTGTKKGKREHKIFTSCACRKRTKLLSLFFINSDQCLENFFSKAYRKDILELLLLSTDREHSNQ